MYTYGDDHSWTIIRVNVRATGFANDSYTGYTVH